MQQGMTKKQSLSLQGAAVLLMIYHHFFNDPSIYQGSLFFFHETAVLRIAWFGKICVGIFAFVSGYGMFKVLEKRKVQWKEDDFFKRLVKEYGVCVSQILKLLFRYWLVLLLFLILYLALGKRTFDWREFLGNVFCTNPTYNGAFWYVEQYVKMLLMLPLLDLLLEKREKRQETSKWIFYGGMAAAGIGILIAAAVREPIRDILISAVKALRPAFFAVFGVGYLAARFGIAEFIGSKAERMKKLPKCVLGMGLFLTAVLVRILLADSASYATFDFVIVPVWCLGFLMITGEMKGLQKGFAAIGQVSAYMWLSHIFVFELTGPFLMQGIRSHFLFWLCQAAETFLLSYGVAFVLNKIKKRK